MRKRIYIVIVVMLSFVVAYLYHLYTQKIGIKEYVVLRTNRTITDSSFIGPNGKSLLVFTGNDRAEYIRAGAENVEYHVYRNSITQYCNGQHFAFAASRNNSQYIVVDGIEKYSFEGELTGGIYVNHDGSRIAWIVNDRDRLYLIVNGHKSKPYEGMYRPAFSPNGKHIVYFAHMNNRLYFVRDNIYTRCPLDEIISGVVWRNEEEYAYIGTIKNKASMVLNGKIIRTCDDFGDWPLFSPDGNKFAYTYKSDNVWHVTVSDRSTPQHSVRTSPPYTDLGKGSLCFSPDSRHLAYEAMEGTARRVFYDFKGSIRYDDTGAGGNSFSPNSQHFSFVAKAGRHWFVVSDGIKGGNYDSIGRDTQCIVYSPDSNNIAYGAMKNGKWCVVYNGREGKLYSNIGYLRFDPTSTSLAYIAKVGTKCIVVLNGREGKKYDLISPDSLRFTSKDSIEYYAATNHKVMRVEHK